ncbi:hypothetical protein [Mesorhizobium sp. WSM3626]|uniref:hypothetical protein n=1 Tax=Mesorhizobium sp. WSM3626 TaxID=1040987 RepID=UPI0012EB7B3F|nr:hypothetical protein [Mesorhizobium sp. WSM3626]
MTVNGAAATEWSAREAVLAFISGGRLNFFVCQAGALVTADIVYTGSAGAQAASLIVWTLGNGLNAAPVDGVTSLQAQSARRSPAPSRRSVFASRRSPISHKKGRHRTPWSRMSISPARQAAIASSLVTWKRWSLARANTVLSASAAATGANLFAWVISGTTATPLNVVSSAQATSGSIALNDIETKVAGAAIALDICSPTIADWTESWSGSETVVEEADVNSATGNHRILACHFATISASTTQDLTLTLSASQAHVARCHQLRALNLGSDHPRMQHLADVDGWQPGLRVNRAFDRNADARNGGKRDKGGERHGKASALLRHLHGVGQIVENGFHQRTLNDPFPTTS